MSEPINSPPLKLRVVICLGEHCNLWRGGTKIEQALLPFVQELRIKFPNIIFKMETARCLSHCEEGPNVMIYPMGTLFHHLEASHLKEMKQFLEDTANALQQGDK